MSILKQILGQNSHWQINKDIARVLGLEAALLLSDLIDKWGLYGYPEWFFNTVEDIERDTTLSKRQQLRAIKVLTDKKFIVCELKGMPLKRHFKVVESNIIKYFKKVVSQLGQNGPTEWRKTVQLNGAKRSNKLVQNEPTSWNETYQHVGTKRSNMLVQNEPLLTIHNNKNNNKRESNALAFLEENYPSVFESLLLKYKSKIKDFQKASNDFNLKFDVENHEYDVKIINARSQLFFNRWIENENKFNQNASSGLIDRQNDVYKQTRF